MVGVSEHLTVTFYQLSEVNGAEVAGERVDGVNDFWHDFNCNLGHAVEESICGGAEDAEGSQRDCQEVPTVVRTRVLVFTSLGLVSHLKDVEWVDVCRESVVRRAILMGWTIVQSISKS